MAYPIPVRALTRLWLRSCSILVSDQMGIASLRCQNQISSRLSGKSRGMGACKFASYLQTQPARKKNTWLYVMLAIVGVLLVVFAGSYVIFSNRLFPTSTFVPSTVSTAAAQTRTSTSSAFHSTACQFTVASTMVEGRDV